MKVYDKFKEYIWLVQTIHKYKRISLDDINRLWCQTEMSGGVEIARTSFKRDKNAIQDIFGLYIECDVNNGYKYYIGNSHTLEEDSIQNWMLSTLSVNNIISEGLSVQDRIQIESIHDERYLAEMIEAMKKGVMVEIEYRRFGSADTKKHVFEPYALKVYQRRWYVLAFFPARVDEAGKAHRAHFAIFSFDRIVRVSLTTEKFIIDKDFSAKDFFNDSYGIVAGEEIETENVVIRAYGREVFDMRALPLHHSQIEMNTTPEYSDFHLHIKPTLDFAGKLLSRGAWIEVLEPQSLREQLIDMHRKSLERYGK